MKHHSIVPFILSIMVISFIVYFLVLNAIDCAARGGAYMTPEGSWPACVSTPAPQ